MNLYRRILVELAVALFASLVFLSGCSEERKREAARIAAEMEAKERGETLPPEPVLLDSAASDSNDIGAIDAGMTEGTDQQIDTLGLTLGDSVLSLVESKQAEQSNRLSVPGGTPTMPAVITDGWTVQVESSPLQAYVESQVQVFKDRGYDAYLGSVTKENKTYYRLRVGKFTDRAEAVRVSAEINSMYNLQSWVDRASW